MKTKLITFAILLIVAGLIWFLSEKYITDNIKQKVGRGVSIFLGLLAVVSYLFDFEKPPIVDSTPVQTLAPVQTNTPDTWGAWSSWSSEYVSPSSTREVQTSNDVIGYNMVHYGTQLAEYPHCRMFRDYSIKNNMNMYNARDSYGEKHLTKRISAEQMEYATVFPPDGSFITLRNKITDETYEGYQLGNSNAYNFGDDFYVWFVESPIYGTVYRYRDLIHH